MTENLNEELFEAAGKGDTGAVWNLLDRGADIKAKGKNDWIPLNVAVTSP